MERVTSLTMVHGCEKVGGGGVEKGQFKKDSVQ